MNEFITETGKHLIAFTDESLMTLSEHGVHIYFLFKTSEGDVKVNESLTKVIWDKEREDYLSFFQRIYPMGVRGCLGMFYSKEDIGDE